MSTFNVPSLFLPYVRGVNRSSVIDLNFVIDIVENLLQARGAISRIDHRPTKDGMGSMCSFTSITGHAPELQLRC